MLLPLELQKEAAQKALDEFTRKARADFEAVAGKSNKVNDSLEQIAASTRRIDFGAAMDRGISKFGDLKDIVEKTGASVFGLSEETTKAAASSLDMSQKFASFGALLGPVGVGIGAVVGGLVGYISATNTATEATYKLTEAEQKQTDARVMGLASTARSLKGLALGAGFDVFNIKGAGIEELEKRSKSLGQSINTTARQALEAAEDYKALAGSANVVASDVEVAKIRLDDYSLTLSEHKLEQTEVKKAIDAYNKSIDESITMVGVIAPKTKTQTAVIKEQTQAYKEYIDIFKGTKGGGVNQLAVDAAARDAQEKAALANFDAQESYNTKIENASKAHYQRVAANRKAIQEADAIDAEALRQQEIAGYANQVSKVTSITSELTGQLEANVAAGGKLFNDFGVAAERGVSQVLKSLSKEWTVKAIGETAEGLAALASQRYKSAGEHFASAAGFGAAAVAAGVGGAVVGGDASRRANDAGGDAGGGSSSGGSAGSSGRVQDPGTQNLQPLVINFNSTVPATEREAQEAASKIQDLLDRGRRR